MAVLCIDEIRMTNMTCQIAFYTLLAFIQKQSLETNSSICLNYSYEKCVYK